MERPYNPGGFGSFGYIKPSTMPSMVDSLRQAAGYMLEKGAEKTNDVAAFHLLRHNFDALGSFGDTLWGEIATVHNPFLSKHMDPVVRAFEDAQYNSKIHDPLLGKLFHENDLSQLMTPNNPYVDWRKYLGDQDSQALRTAVAQMARSLYEVPLEMGFQGRARYDLREGKFFDRTLHKVNNPDGSKKRGLAEELLENFLKGHREDLKLRPNEQIPYLSLFKGHMKGAAAQQTFQPFTGNAGSVTLAEDSLYKQLQVLAEKGPDVKTRMAAEETLHLIDGSGQRMVEATGKAILRAKTGQILVQNLKVVLNSATDYASLTGVSPNYLVQGMDDAFQNPVMIQLLDRVTGKTKNDRDTMADILDTLRLRDTREYMADQLSPTGVGDFKPQAFDIMSKGEVFFRRAAAAARIRSEAEKAGMTLEQLLDPRTDQERLTQKAIFGAALKTVKETQGFASEFDKLMLAGSNALGGATYLKNAPITTMGTLYGMGKKAMGQFAAGDDAGALRTSAALTQALAIRLAVSGGKAVLDPKTATLLLTIPGVAAVPTLHDWLISARDGTLFNEQMYGVEEIPRIDSAGQVIDNALGTNFAAAASPVLPSASLVPGFELFMDQGHNVSKLFKYDSNTPSENTDAIGALVREGGSLLPVAAPFGISVPVRTGTNTVSAFTHGTEAGSQDGTRAYAGTRIPVNPMGEAIGVFLGGSGPAGNTFQRRAIDTPGQFNALHHQFYDYVRTHPEQAAQGIYPPEMLAQAKQFLDLYGQYKYPDLNRQEMGMQFFQDATTEMRETGRVEELIDQAGQLRHAYMNGDTKSVNNLSNAINENLQRLRQENPDLYGDWDIETVIEKYDNRRSE